MSPGSHLFGRAELLTALQHAVERPGALVTLTSLPGAGTTSLARAIARSWDTDLVDGRGLKQPGALAAALERRADAALVVVDDVDQTSDGPAAVRSLRRSRPMIRMLLTSGTPLGLAEETVVRVPPLPLPDPSEDPDTLRRQPAIQLFLQVAERTGTTAMTDRAALRPAASVCRLVGGLPLAIELVAARTATYSPATLVHLLQEDPLGVLRQHTEATHDLIAAVTWSVSQLAPRQRALLQQLSYFAGPVTYEVIEEVCPTPGLVDDLSALVDVHLVEPEHAVDGTAYRVPTIVRSHLLSTRDPGGDAQLPVRHLRWMRRTAVAAVTLHQTGDLAGARDLAAAAEADLVLALRHCLRAPAADSRIHAADLPTEVALILALLPLWLNRGVTAGQARTTDQVLARVPADANGQLVLTAWRELMRAELATTTAEVARVITVLGELRRLTADRRTLLEITYIAVQAARALPVRTPVEEWAAEGRALATELGDSARLTKLETWTAMLAHQRGDDGEAVRWAQIALRRARQAGDSSLLLAPSALLHSLPEGRTDTSGVSRPQVLVQIARECGELSALDWIQPTAAMVALRQGDVVAAAQHSAATLRRVQSTGATKRSGPALLCLFLLSLQLGQLRWAGRLHGMLGRYSQVLLPSLPPGAAASYDEAVAALHASPGSAQLESAVTWGARLSAEEAVDAALGYAADLLHRDLMGAEAHPQRRPQLPTWGGLTDREQEVLALMTSGGTNRDIAEALGISAKTVMHHTSNIYRKLGVRGRAEAVASHLRGRVRPIGPSPGPGGRAGAGGATPGR